MSCQEKYCKGCLNYYLDSNNIDVCISGIKNFDKCPCIDCLIKIICEDSCDKFKQFNSNDRKK